MRTTFMAKSTEVERQWYVIDAEGKTLGRLASEAAALLRGKHKVTFTPHVDCGDNVIIINADKIVLTGNKLNGKPNGKNYHNASGHIGGLRTRTAATMLDQYPTEMLEIAIKGMLPKTRLGRQMFKKLFVYAGPEHKHTAQQPTAYELRG